MTLTKSLNQNGKAVKETKKGDVLSKITTALTSEEIIKLLHFMYQFCMLNQQGLPSRTSKWAGRNYKTLSDIKSQIDFDKKNIEDDFEECTKWIEKHNDKPVVWDEVDDNVVYITEGKDKVVDDANSTYGVKAYLNFVEGKPEYINIANGKKLAGDIIGKMKPYVVDTEKRKTYEEKLTAREAALEALKDKKWAVTLVKISETYLETTRAGMPVIQATQNGPSLLDASIAFDYLIEEKDDL